MFQQEAVKRRDRILIVDDEELIVLAMRRYFEGLGYLVDSAHELEEAQATGKQKLVDTGGRVERFQRRAAKRQRGGS